MPEAADEFTLYDLRVEVVGCRGTMASNYAIGDCHGELTAVPLPPDGS